MDDNKFRSVFLLSSAITAITVSDTNTLGNAM